MATVIYRQNNFFGIQRKEFLLLLLVYLIFGAAYDQTIYLTSNRQAEFNGQIIIDYTLKALLTIPIWFLFFRKFKHWTILQKVILHVFLIPIFAFTWRTIYYTICDAIGMWHLDHPAHWWDIYIPSLFYVLQFGIFHVYDFNRQLKHKLQLEHELRELALQGELSALKAQLNPHFLYNTFNAISASVPPGQEATRELIAKLSDLFRYQLQATKKDRVLLEEELAFVEKYLSLEKARLGERLETSIYVDEELKQVLIPPMILQPLVENAIIHGISPKIEGGKINIDIRQKNGDVHFNITDTGIGLQEKKTNTETGIGLTNTRKRLKKLFESNLLLNPVSTGGLSVQFSIPSKLLQAA